jgi:hypothetical protein
MLAAAAGLRDHSFELMTAEVGRKLCLRAPVKKSAEEVRQCYEHAEECTGQARAPQDEKAACRLPSPCTGLVEAGRELRAWLRLKLFTNEAARRKNDLNQNIRQWQAIFIAQ